MKNPTHASKKQFCPTCGKTMNFLDSKKLPDENGKLENIMEHWNCLNCQEDWEIHLPQNIIKLTPNDSSL